MQILRFKSYLRKTSSLLLICSLLCGFMVFDCEAAATMHLSDRKRSSDNITLQQGSPAQSMSRQSTSCTIVLQQTPCASVRPSVSDNSPANVCAKWTDIFSHVLRYPPELLHALRRNPEMLDFVYGYPDAKHIGQTTQKASGKLIFQEASKTCPLFIQWDPRWGYVSYGKTNIAISGCGPTCLSMVLYSLTGNPILTPDFLAQRAMKEGYYVNDIGTDWSFLTKLCADYGVTAEQHTELTEKQMRTALKDGKLIIASMKPGDFTDTGHFIVIRGVCNEGFLVNDPFSYSNSEKIWDYDTLNKQWKQLWVYEAPYFKKSKISTDTEF